MSHRPAGPMRLGLTLRSVALCPRDGYAAAKRTGERRARAGERLPEGVSPYVLALVGGAAVMCLWLKVGALGGLRDATSAGIDGAVVASALVLGGLLSVAGQFLWGAAGPRLLLRLGGHARGRDLRLAWGASAFPLVGVLLLLPLDLVLVGPSVFAIDPLSDSIATAWAALSIAVGVALAAWSLWLFLRGVEVASGLRLRRAAPAALLGTGGFALLVYAVALLSSLAMSRTPS
ncbi:hypothetical protein BH24ACT26_BH24ACT26_00860 [soil metagenome]